jgi:drug/metabolite transporter (DMT)-like permease
MGNFGPVATIIMAIWILGEPFTLFHAIGTALVLAGAVWFGRAAAMKKPAPAPEA